MVIMTMMTITLVPNDDDEDDDGSYDGVRSDNVDNVSAPSYEECTTVGQVDLREAGDSEYLRGDLKWFPRYPMYRQLSEPQGPGTSALAPSHVNIDDV